MSIEKGVNNVRALEPQAREIEGSFVAAVEELNEAAEASNRARRIMEEAPALFARLTKILDSAKHANAAAADHTDTARSHAAAGYLASGILAEALKERLEGVEGCGDIFTAMGNLSDASSEIQDGTGGDVGDGIDLLGGNLAIYGRQHETNELNIDDLKQRTDQLREKWQSGVSDLIATDNTIGVQVDDGRSKANVLANMLKNFGVQVVPTTPSPPTTPEI